LTVFSSLGLALATVTNLGLRKSDNHRAAADALLAAESGMSFMLHQLNTVRLPGTTTQETFVTNLAEVLGKTLNGTGNLGNETVSGIGETFHVPGIKLEEKLFWCRLTWVQKNRCRMITRGWGSGLSREIAIDLDLIPRQPRVFDYGLASRGKISIFGNAKIVGVNDPSEANVLSATRDNIEAIHVDGQAVISGDLSVTDIKNKIVITGSPSIAGSTDPAVYCQHLHFGVDEPDFPELDTAPLVAFAKNVVDSTTDVTTSGQTFTNIRIAAGTNPIFAANTTINGAVYVEAPNIVRFEGGTTINGFVVTEDNSLNIETCQVFFSGHVDAIGVDALPDTEEFAAIKQQTGTFVVAPGFSVTFEGSFSTINGSIAADRLTFTGTAEGVIKGSVIGLEDRITKVGGNVEIQVDHRNSDPNPAGFVESFAFEPDANSYTELLGGQDKYAE
jgi:hypothetical protein